MSARRYRPRLVALLAYACALVLASAVAAQSTGGLERSVKAAFIYKFLAFVDWPEESFVRHDSALVIGVHNADDIAAELEPMVQGRTVGGHPVELRRVKAGDSLTGLHVLFIGRTEGARFVQLARAAQQQSILTLSESPGALELGSVINLLVADGRVRFEVALDTAEKSRLKLSSRLLSLAVSVRNVGS